MTRSSFSTKGRAAAIGLALVAFAAGTAAAADKTCMPEARGVPFRDGPPNWRHGSPPSDRDQNWDDPRWRGAMGLSYAIGTANPPVQARAAWGTEGTNRYLYLQWLVRTAVYDQPHMLMVGFRRAGADTFPAGTERAIMVQLNLAPSTTAGFVHPLFCSDSTGSACALASTDAYSVFADTGNTNACPTLTGLHTEFTQLTAGYGWIDESAHYQRVCDGTTCDLWAISLRVPVVGSAQPFTDGIHEDDQLWYEVRLPTTSGLPPCTGSNPCALIDSWPRTPPPAAGDPVVDPLCRLGGDPASWYHSGLATSTTWSTVDIAPGSPGGAGCFGGLKLTPDDIGVLVDAGPPATSPTAALSWLFKVYNASMATAVNRVVARPRNDTAADITGVLKARFRMAQWGAEAIGANGAWTDVRGTSAACMEDPAQPNRTCTTSPITIPGSTTQPTAALRKGAISFEWTIGTDATLQASEICQYGATPVGGDCDGSCPLPPAASCTSTATCGTRGRIGAGAYGPCLRKLNDHQCVLVELDSTSTVNFENTSVYRNMNIAQMSETTQEAWITTRGLPLAPGQKLEEIYLVVMPRNLPRTVPQGTTGLDLVQQEARAELGRLLRPYREAAERLQQDPNLRGQVIEQVRAMRALDDADPVVFEPPGQDFPQGDLPEAVLELMPRGTRGAAQILDGVGRYRGAEGRPDGFGGWSYGAAAATDLVLDTFDDVAATAILPTLDFYVYRRVPGASGMSAMSSFTLVVHHEGVLTGVSWEIDGATRLGKNLFRVDLPTGHRKRIQIRAMAHEGGPAQVPGNRDWPCAGGCCGRSGYCSEPDLAMGQGLPLVIVAAVWGGAGVRRRKKPRPRA